MADQNQPVGEVTGASPGTTKPERPPNNELVVAVGTVVLIVIGLALLASLINLWPTIDAGTTATAATAARSGPEPTVRLLFATVSVKVTPSTALLLLVMIAGALGSLIQTATSFADFVGNRRFYSSWVPWYLVRLVIGVLLALLLYFVFRGGFFSGSSPTTAVNPYGIAALSGLAGLFSKQATDKLREVFETLFRVASGGGDTQRKDDLANAVPTVTAVDPTVVTAGSSQITLTVQGSHFVKGTSAVRINGADHHTTFVSAQELTVSLPDELVADASSLKLTVYNGPPGGGESQPPAILSVIPAQ
jgi:IPT/TIG domain